MISYSQACIALPLGLFLNHIPTSSTLLMTLVLIHMLQTHGSPAFDSSIQFDNLQDFDVILCHVHKCHKCPPAWLFKDDIYGAFCRFPVHPFWQIKQIIMIDGQCHMDHCMEFGTCSAAHIWCTFMGLVIWIALHVKNLPDILHYMDDTWSYEMDSSLQLYEPYNELYPSKQV